MAGSNQTSPESLCLIVTASLGLGFRALGWKGMGSLGVLRFSGLTLGEKKGKFWNYESGCIVGMRWM